MSKEDILLWANTCMDFVYNDLGYTKEQVLHSVIHLDEKTPHIHCVVIPLIKKYDKRTNTERHTISKKQYIRDKLHLSELQDKYHKRLTDKRFDLERGIKNSDNKNIPIKEFKKITRKLNNQLNIKNENLNKAMNELQDKMNSNKKNIFDNEYVKIKKDTFDSINKVMTEAENLMKVQPKLQQIYNEVESYTKSYQCLEKENKNIKREIINLKNKNEELNQENSKLTTYLKLILEAIKTFFRELLLFGNDKVKQATTKEIKDYYDNKDFNKRDVIDIAKDTNKEDDLFNYIDYKNKKNKDDFELSL